MGKAIIFGGAKNTSTPSTISPILNDNSWEQIKAASDMGVASSLWNVGDRKKITLNGAVGNLPLSNYDVYAYIIGFDHNAELEGSNRIHFQIGKTEDGVDVALCDGQYGAKIAATGYFSMNNTNANVGGWADCQMRTVICEAMKSVVPSELQTALKSVTKYTDNTGNKNSTASAITATTDYFFLLSEYEVLGSRAYANTNESSKQAQYAYYSAGNSKIKHKHSATSTVSYWWLRSTLVDYADGFTFVYSDGTVSGLTSYFSYGFAPAFCV